MKPPSFAKLCDIAQAEVDAVLKRFPKHLREAVERVPVRLEPYPDAASGLEEDLLGVFLGNPLADMEGPYASPEPTEVVLFLDNLWDYAEGDESVFREEVRVTLVHELGHFLGLNENDLDERGLG